VKTRALTFSLIVVSTASVLALLVASALSPGVETKTRLPYGEVRVEKVLDLQLPEV